MLSYNNKKLLFKPKITKKVIIIIVGVSVLLSFLTGIAVYTIRNMRANAKSTTAYSNLDTENSNAFTDGPIRGASKMDKHLKGIEKDTQKNGAPLMDYEVKFEDVFKKDGVKNAFLTFDDGPTKQITPQILDILNRYNIKASFFIVGKNAERFPDILKREYSEGNSINLHSYSHSYEQIYSNPQAFQDDLNRNVSALKNALGQEFSTRIYRFPGGSVGGSYGEFKKLCREQLKTNGYVSIDWNALTKDAESIKENGKWRKRTPAELLDELKQSMAQRGNPEDVVILMHDAADKQFTADALPSVIEYLKSQGYNFKTMK